MEDKRAYVVSDELMHYGVKGMKWKDHLYKTYKNGEYIYNQLTATPIQKQRQAKYHPTSKIPALKTTKANEGSMNTHSLAGRNYGTKVGVDENGNPVYATKTKTKYTIGSNRKTRVTTLTTVKNDGKSHLVTKVSNDGTHKVQNANGKGNIYETHRQTVTPGKYNSYGEAIKGESTKAYKTITGNAKNAYKVTATKASAGAKAAKAVGNSLKDSSKDIKYAAKESVKTAKNDAKWASDLIKQGETAKEKAEIAKAIYDENYKGKNRIQGIKEYNNRKSKGYKEDKAMNVSTYETSTGREYHDKYMQDSKGNAILVGNNPYRLGSHTYVATKANDKGTGYTHRERGALEVAGSKAIKAAKKAYSSGLKEANQKATTKTATKTSKKWTKQYKKNKDKAKVQSLT